MVYKSAGLHIFALQKYSLVNVGFESKELKTVRRPADHPRAKMIFMLQKFSCYRVGERLD